VSILDNLPHTAKKLRRTRAQDEYGGTRDTFAQVGADLSCWRQAATEREIERFSKRGISVTDKVYFTANPSLDEQYILEIGSSWYEVRSVSDPDASVGLAIVWRAMVELTTVGTTPYLQTTNPTGNVDTTTYLVDDLENQLVDDAGDALIAV